MNDRVLNEKESLELIAQMIQNTKSRMTRNSGAPFLIWGYTTIIVSLLVWFLLKETGNYHWQWLWFLLPAISLPSTLWIEHKQPKMIKTYIDRIVGYVWAVFGLGAFCFLGFHLLLEYVCPFVILLMMGMGTALTGLIIKMKVVTVCGVVGALASVGCIYVHGFDQILVLHRLLFL